MGTMVQPEPKVIQLDPALLRAREAVALPLPSGHAAERIAPNGVAYDHRFIASTERLATDGGVIMCNGWRTDGYLERGGPFIENHDLYASNGLARTLLGSTVHAGVENGLDPAMVGPSGRALVEYVRFAKTPYAQEVKSLYDDGHLRCVSVRWDPRSEQARAPFEAEIQQFGQGLQWVATSTEQIELSGVILGADPGALDDTPRGLRVAPEFMDAFERARSGGVKLPEIEKRIREIEATHRVMVAIRVAIRDGKSSAETAQSIAAALDQDAADARVHAENDKTSVAGGKLTVDAEGEEENENQTDDTPAEQAMEMEQPAPDAGIVGQGGPGTTVQVVDNQEIPSDAPANQAAGSEGMLNSADEPVAGKIKDKAAAVATLVISVNIDMTPRADEGALDVTKPEIVAKLIADGRAQVVQVVRMLDQTATQDALAQMDQGFDALDAILGAVGPVRQQLDDARMLVKNLIANSLETAPEVKTALTQQTPSGTAAPAELPTAAKSSDDSNAAGAKVGSKTQAKADVVAPEPETAATPVRITLDLLKKPEPPPAFRFTKELLATL